MNTNQDLKNYQFTTSDYNARTEKKEVEITDSLIKLLLNMLVKSVQVQYNKARSKNLH